jgi:ferredoxin--NADP+ reductase
MRFEDVFSVQLQAYAKPAPEAISFSVVSAAHDEHLEFLAVLVPGGEFSGLLGRVRERDAVLVEKAGFGFMTVDQFAPGRDLWLVGSGTGLGPFLSILHDPSNWQAFERLIVVHSVRRAADLAYREEIAAIPRAPLLAEARARLTYVPVVTRERYPGALDARIPQLIDDGRLEQAAGVRFDPQHSRVMVCGNPELARELRRRFTARGFAVNRRAAPGQLAFENYWQGASS